MATSAQVVPVASVFQSLLAGDIGRPYYTARTSLNTLALLDPLTDDEVREGGPNSPMKAPVKPRVDHLPYVLLPCSTAGAWSFSHWCPVIVPGTRYDLTHGSLIFAEGLCAQNSKEGSRGHELSHQDAAFSVA